MGLILGALFVLVPIGLAIFVAWDRAGAGHGCAVAAAYLTGHVAFWWGGGLLANPFNGLFLLLLILVLFMPGPLLVAWMYDAVGRRVTGVFEPRLRTRRSP